MKVLVVLNDVAITLESVFSLFSGKDLTNLIHHKLLLHECISCIDFGVFFHLLIKDSVKNLPAMALLQTHLVLLNLDWAVGVSVD